VIRTATSLAALRTGFSAMFQTGFDGVKPTYLRIATSIPSSTKSNTYGWLGDLPGMREWIGDRQVKGLSEKSYVITNKDFESTVGVKGTDIDDDNLGMYPIIMQGLGQEAGIFPDELTFELLKNGFTERCHDGQFFFDTDHPRGENGAVVSNMTAGAAPAWFLLDTSRPLKPLIFQDRQKPKFVAMTSDQDESVFTRKEYRYGVDMRCNVGYGFWQLAHGAKVALNEANYEAVYLAMTTQKRDDGKPLRVKPNLIVVGPSNRAAAKKLFETATVAAGGDNTYYKDVEVLVVDWLE
jgi:phage major head subunit gpT-like protein